MKQGVSGEGTGGQGRGPAGGIRPELARAVDLGREVRLKRCSGSSEPLGSRGLAAPVTAQGGGSGGSRRSAGAGRTQERRDPTELEAARRIEAVA